MNAVEFYRGRRHLTAQELAERAGVSTNSIFRLEQDGALDLSYSIYERVAAALDVTTDDLICEVSGWKTDYGDHYRVSGGADENPYNCLAHYRQEKNLYYWELADLLEEKSISRVRDACLREFGYGEYVRKLAELEGLTVEGFKIVYREGELL